VPAPIAATVPGGLQIGDDNGRRRAAGSELARAILGRSNGAVIFDLATDSAAERGTHRGKYQERETVGHAAKARA